MGLWGGRVAVVMQCLTQLASPAHLPGSSWGSSLTFTQHDVPLLGQSHSSGALAPPSCTLIMTRCICAFHTFKGASYLGEISITMKLLRGFAHSFVILYQQFSFFSALTPVTLSPWDHVTLCHPEQFKFRFSNMYFNIFWFKKKNF